MKPSQERARHARLRRGRGFRRKIHVGDFAPLAVVAADFDAVSARTGRRGSAGLDEIVGVGQRFAVGAEHDAVDHRFRRQLNFKPWGRGGKVGFLAGFPRAPRERLAELAVDHIGDLAHEHLRRLERAGLGALRRKSEIRFAGGGAENLKLLDHRGGWVREANPHRAGAHGREARLEVVGPLLRPRRRQREQFGAHGVELLPQAVSPGRAGGGIGHITPRAVAVFEALEHGGERVVILLRNRVELVVVAAGARHRDP